MLSYIYVNTLLVEKNIGSIYLLLLIHNTITCIFLLLAQLSEQEHKRYIREMKKVSEKFPQPWFIISLSFLCIHTAVVWSSFIILSPSSYLKTFWALVQQAYHIIYCCYWSSLNYKFKKKKENEMLAVKKDKQISKENKEKKYGE